MSHDNNSGVPSRTKNRIKANWLLFVIGLLTLICIFDVVVHQRKMSVVSFNALCVYFFLTFITIYILHLNDLKFVLFIKVFAKENGEYNVNNGNDKTHYLFNYS
jgi:hypothetical protein